MATAGATIGHGLSAAPDVVIVKNIESAREWMFGHQAYVNGGNSENLNGIQLLFLHQQMTKQVVVGTDTAFATSSVFTVGDGQDGDYTMVQIMVQMTM